MRVGWLHDDPGFLGGAELTMVEFAAAAPAGVEIVECPPGDVDQDLDRYVVGNCMSLHGQGQAARPLEAHHSLPPRRHPDPRSTGILSPKVRHIFCSPLQRARMETEGELIPPALDLAPYRMHANQNHRTGAVCVGRMAYGKGLELLAEYPEPVDVYSSVPGRLGGERPLPGAVRGRGRDPEPLSAVRLPADRDRAVRPRGGRGVGGGARA